MPVRVRVDPKADAALGITLDAVPTRVDEAMMLMAEKHGSRGSSRRRAPNVACGRLQASAALAAGEAAGLPVARLEEPAERGRKFPNSLDGRCLH